MLTGSRIISGVSNNYEQRFMPKQSASKEEKAVLIRLWGSSILDAINFYNYKEPTFIIFFSEAVDYNYKIAILLKKHKFQNIASFEPYGSYCFPDLTYSCKLKNTQTGSKIEWNETVLCPNKISIPCGIPDTPGEYLLEITLNFATYAKVFVNDFINNRFEPREISFKPKITFKRTIYVAWFEEEKAQKLDSLESLLYSEEILNNKINLLYKEYAKWQNCYENSYLIHMPKGLTMKDKSMKMIDSELKFWQLYKETVYGSTYNKLFIDKNMQEFYITNKNIKNKIKDINSEHITNEMHYARNDFNRYFLKLDDLIDYNVGPGKNTPWKLLKPFESAYHMHGLEGEYNVKLVSNDEMFEAIYDSRSGNLIMTPNNMGTYNYFGPSNAILHSKYDVEPYFKYGNTSNDPPLGVFSANTMALANNAKFKSNYKAQAHYFYIMLMVDPNNFEEHMRKNKRIVHYNDIYSEL